jgi:hypothetical protein
LPIADCRLEAAKWQDYCNRDAGDFHCRMSLSLCSEIRAQDWKEEIGNRQLAFGNV